MNSSPIGVSLSGTPAIHPTRLSGMKLGMAVFSAMAGQLSVAAATKTAIRLRGLPGDVAFVMWGIGASSISDLVATRFWRAFYRKQSCPRHGFDHTMRPHACLRSWHCGASHGLLRRYGERRRVGWAKSPAAADDTARRPRATSR